MDTKYLSPVPRRIGGLEIMTIKKARQIVVPRRIGGLESLSMRLMIT